MSGEELAAYPHVLAAHEYAQAVLDGEIPACSLVKAACRRQFEDLERQGSKDFPYYFDPRAAQRVCSFLERLPHIKGVWAQRRERIRLQPWQSFVTAVPFGWRRMSDHYRRFREAYLEVPRKNAKSTLGAGIGLYMLVADGEAGAEVFSGATSQDQAYVVFGAARKMAEKSKGFCEHFGLEVLNKSIIQPATASVFRPLIGKPGDGDNPHCSIVDEYHEHPTSELYDAMKTGMGSRAQPMQWVITTAGTNLAGPCYDKRDQVVKVLEGTIRNEELFGLIYTLDKDDDWTDPKVWAKANPNIGVSVFKDYLQGQLREARQRASQQNILRCKHLNQWMNAGTAWIDVLKWHKCHDESLTLDDFQGEPCWVAIDLASKIDVASMVVLFRRGDDFHVFDRHYIPETQLDDPKNSHYAKWHAQGLLTVTPGARTDQAFIEEDLADLNRRFDVRELIFDPSEAQYIINRLDDKLSCEIVEFPQNAIRFNEPMKELEAVYSEGRLHHNSPILDWMASNVELREARNKRYSPAKGTRAKKIDGIVALIMALARAMAVQSEEKPGIFDWSTITATTEGNA